MKYDIDFFNFFSITGGGMVMGWWWKAVKCRVKAKEAPMWSLLLLDIADKSHPN